MTISVHAEPATKTLYRLSIYNDGQYIGEYERSQEPDIERKKAEIRDAQELLLAIFQKYGEFCVRWDGKDRKKSVRVDGIEVGVVPKSAWKTPSWQAPNPQSHIVPTLSANIKADSQTYEDAGTSSAKPNPPIERTAHGESSLVPPLGFAAARHVLELGRSAFFGSQAADLPKARSPLVMGDNQIPQFGFVGSNFSRVSVLLLGINPGNGPEDRRNPEDEVMMPALHRFVVERTHESFLEAQRTYQQVCQSWRVWRVHCSEIIRAGHLSPDDVAYSNCLPWRTASKSGFDETIKKKAATLYAYPLIDELRPRLIIALGKKVASILSTGGRSFPNLIIWNRAQASTPAVLQERSMTAAQIRRILGQVAL